MNTRFEMAAAAAFAGLGLLALSSVAASARIVCNSDGDCWRVHEDYGFPPGAHVELHPDNWR